MSKTINRRKLSAPRKSAASRAKRNAIVRKRKGPVVVKTGRELMSEFFAESRSITGLSPDPCTCPSGNGSLRWPCPIHPPRDYAEGPTGLNGGRLPMWITRQLAKLESQQMGEERTAREVFREFVYDNQAFLYMAGFVLLIVGIAVATA